MKRRFEGFQGKQEISFWEDHLKFLVSITLCKTCLLSTLKSCSIGFALWITNRLTHFLLYCQESTGTGNESRKADLSSAPSFGSLNDLAPFAGLIIHGGFVAETICWSLESWQYPSNFCSRFYVSRSAFPSFEGAIFPEEAAKLELLILDTRRVLYSTLWD